MEDLFRLVGLLPPLPPDLGQLPENGAYKSSRRRATATSTERARRKQIKKRRAKKGYK